MKKHYALLACLLMILCACTPTESAEPAAPPDTADPSPTTAPPTVEEPTASPSPTQALPPPVQTLNEGEGMQRPGPWLTFQTDEGFFFVSQDGTEVGMVPLSQDYFIANWIPAPAGGSLACLKDNMVEKILEVRSIPDNERLLQLNLSDYPGDPPAFVDENTAYQYGVDRYSAVGQMRWSHQGDILAFVASYLGPSPDVYTFDLRTGEISQLTSGPFHAVYLNWSPDDRYIFHASVEEMFRESSGSGYGGWVFYAASADGTEILQVAEGMKDRIEEHIVGWVDDTTILIANGQWWCGLFNLRKIDIENSQETTLWEGQFNDIAYDPESQSALVWVAPEDCQEEGCGALSESGFYKVSGVDGRIDLIAESPKDVLLYSMDFEPAASSFIMETDSGWLVYENASFTFSETQPIYSPDGNQVAQLIEDWGSLVVQDLQGETQFEHQHDGVLLNPVWSPDSGVLFYFAENLEKDSFDLYRVDAASYTSRLILEGRFSRYDNPPVWALP